MTFGNCRVCKTNEATFSNNVCKECHEKIYKIIRQLNEKGFEAGTENFINGLKEAGVYY